MTRIMTLLLLLPVLLLLLTTIERISEGESSLHYHSMLMPVHGKPNASKHPSLYLRRRLKEGEAEIPNNNRDDADGPADEDSTDEEDSADHGGEVIRTGAHKAKLQYKAIDRHSEERAKQLKEYLEQNLHHNIEHIQKEALQLEQQRIPNAHDHDELTAKMKVHAPGTPEFKARQKALMDKVKSMQEQTKDHEDQSTPLLPIQHVDSKHSAGEKKGKIKSFLAKHLPRKPSNLLRRTVAKIPFLRSLHKPMSLEEEMILDASVSFFVHLETQIYDSAEGHLGNEQQMIALSDWLDLVSLTLPPEWHLHRLIDDLQEQFSHIAGGAGNMQEVLFRHKLKHKQWSHECTIDRGKFRVGFDCGFWKLLHIVTMGVAEQKGGMNLVASGMVGASTKTFSPLEAADVIKNLIKYFYNPDYSTNFVQDYDDCKNHRRCDRLTDEKEGASIGDWKELPLWLWEVHNEISIKVLKEKTQKKYPEILELSHEEESKVMWPSVEQCHLCFQEDGTWNENQVFKFLEQHYWTGTDLDPENDHLLQFKADEKDARRTIYELAVVFIGILYILVRLVLSKSYTIQVAFRRARNYANFKKSKARTV